MKRNELRRAGEQAPRIHGKTIYFYCRRHRDLRDVAVGVRVSTHIIAEIVLSIGASSCAGAALHTALLMAVFVLSPSGFLSAFAASLPRREGWGCPFSTKVPCRSRPMSLLLVFSSGECLTFDLSQSNAEGKFIVSER